MTDDPVSDYWDDPARDTVHGPKSYLHREPERRVKYRTIVADPPWQYPDAQPRGPSANGELSWHDVPYVQMPVAAIAAMPISDWADVDAHLYLWTTNRYLRDAFAIMESWGFDFRQVLVWRKTGCPTPFPASIAPNHAEFLLFGRRGNLGLLSRLSSNVIEAPQQRHHSRKPDVFLDLVEQVSPGPYLELFARRRRLGWDAWGNEWYPDIKLDPADLAAYRNACDMADWREDMERGADPELYQAIQRRKRR